MHRACPPARRNPLAAAFATALVSLGLVAIGGGAPGPVAGQAGPSDSAPVAVPGLAYRLVDTWGQVPPRPGPGRFGDAADLGAAPDGTVYLLDRAQNALHVQAPDGHWRARWPHPEADGDWRWLRVDVGPDGRIYLLARRVVGSPAPGRPAEISFAVDVLDAEGVRSARHELGSVAPERYIDLAVRADGRVYLSRTSGDVARQGTNAIDRLMPDGTLAEAWRPPELTIALNLDVAADGTLYLVDQFPHSARPPGPGKVDGVAIFGPDGDYRETVQMSGAMDVAVGPAGVFVSKADAIYRLGERQPLFTGPTIQKNPYRLTSLGIPTMFSLNVSPDPAGPLRAAMSHCSFQGLLEFEPTPDGRFGAPAFSGALDLPSLRGPVYPARVDADRDLRLLQGRFEPATGEGLPVAPFFSALYTADPQTVQRWDPAGALPGQLGACGVWNAPLGVRDLAVEGETVYTIDSQALTRRPDERLAEWTRFGLSLAPTAFFSPLLAAVGADAGRVAILDVGRQGVILTDAAGGRGRLLELPGDPLGVAADLALAGDRLVVGWGGSQRVMDFDLDGLEDDATALVPRAAFTVPGPGPIRSLAAGPAGETVVLSAQGWVWVYPPGYGHADGGAEVDAGASAFTGWPLPDLTVSARDVAVDREGRIHVAWVDAAEAAGPALNLDQRTDIRRAGVWVYAPSHAVETTPAAVRPGACTLVGRTELAPASVAPGDAVEVGLALDGGCSGEAASTQVVVVFNASESMNNDNALDRAKRHTIELLGRLDSVGAWDGPLQTVQLVTFGPGSAGAADRLRIDAANPFGAPGQSEGILQQGVTGPSGAAMAIADLVAAGPTELARALEQAGELLAGSAAPGQRRVVLIVSDGAPLAAGDEPAGAAQTLREDGVELFAAIHPFVGLDEADLAPWIALVGGADRLFTIFTPEAIERQAERLIDEHPAAAAPLPALLVTERLAPGMRYIEGSAEPAADYNPTTHTLTWSFPSAADAARMRYRVQVEGLGSWRRVSEGAIALRTDAPAEPLLRFPVPVLRVRGKGEAYMPVLQR